MCLKVALSVVKICRHKLILTTEWGLACFLKVSGVKPAIHKNRKSPQPGWKQGGRGGWDQVAQLETAQQGQAEWAEGTRKGVTNTQGELQGVLSQAVTAEGETTTWKCGPVL